MRLDLLLIRKYPALSRRKARDVIEKGQVSVGGELVREAGRDLPESAAIAFDPNRKALPKARSTLPVLYQDEQQRQSEVREHQDLRLDWRRSESLH